MLVGSSFQSFAPLTEKALSPMRKEIVRKERRKGQGGESVIGSNM